MTHSEFLSLIIMLFAINLALIGIGITIACKK